MTTPLKNIFVSALVALIMVILPLAGFSQFVANNGQIADENGKVHPEVLFKSSCNDVTLFFKNDGVVYLFTKYITVPTEASREARSHGDEMLAKVLETKPQMFRMDVQFLNTNPNVKVLPSEELAEVTNYYLAHCPDGILGVKHYNKITYKNIYNNIDLVYYFTEKGLKYDLVVFPGAKISDIKFRYTGANGTAISEDGQLNIVYADNQKLFEETPVAFFENEDELKQDIRFSYDQGSDIIGFTGTNLDDTKTLIIDPTINWASYFISTNSSNSSWTNPEYDASGNLFLAVQTYDAAFPMANPGGGAYYDAVKTVMMEVAVLKFNTSRALVWSTYYGGNQYNQLAGCTDYGKALALDNSGNVYVGGQTTGGTTVFPTLNPGGGAFYQDQSRCYGETSFFLKFNNNGVRQWATMFTHETASTSGTMMRVNGITCDGSNLFFTGQQYNWTPANTIPLRNPGGGAHYQTTILGDQDVFVGKFNSAQNLVWCTYVHSTIGTNTAYGQGLDVHCDASGNFYMIGRESGANSHHYLINPGGGAYYQATKGGSDDLIITKFNSALTAVWSTYYGGDGMDICSTIEPDGLGNMYILGRNTPSTNFPTQNPGGGALCQTTKSNAVCDGFLIKFSAAGVRSWATYLGANVPTPGSDENHFSAITFNSSNNDVFVTGYTRSVLMGTTVKAGSYNQAANAGGYDMFMYEFNSAGVVQWASYYGSAANEYFYNGRSGSFMTGCGIKNHFMVNTTSTAMSTTNPGGGAWYQNSSSFAYNDFILEMADFSTPLAVSVSVSPSANPICAGTSVTFTATPTNGGTPSYQWYLNGSPVGSNSSTYTNGSLANGNQVYCVMTSSLTCVTGNPANSGTTTMVVSPVASITSVTGSSPLCIGATANYSANGVVLGGGTGAWSSSNSGIASVNGSGVVSGVSAGTCNIIYTITGGCGGTVSAQQSVTITPNASIASVTGTSPLCIGATAGYSANSVVLGGGTGAWSSGNSGIASVNGSGTVSGVAAGTTNIIYTITGGCNGTPSAQQSVTINPNASIASVTGTSPLCIGATAGYSANSVVLGGGTGAWSSGNSGIASVNGSGTVTGVAAGTTNIIYTITGGCNGTPSAQQSVTVNPNASIASVTGTSPLCIGATAGYSANSVVLGGGTGAWSSGNSGIASVSAGGTVSGVAAGTTNIIYTITGGCNGTPSAQQSVTVNPNASIASVTGTSPLCIGATAGYSANSVVLGGGTGAWSSGNSGTASVSAGGTVTGVAAGTTNIIYTITGGCNGTPSAQQSVTVNPNASIASVTGTSPLCIGATAGYSANSVVLGGGTGAWSSGNSGTASVSAGGTVTGVAAGTTNIIYTITGGCNGTPSAQQSVTVNPNASIASVTGTSPLCIGATAGYSANSVVLGGGTGAWSSGNSGTASVSAGGTVTGVAAGTTNIIYTITGGCNGTPSGQQSVTVNPNASIASVTGTSPLCIGATAGYSANSVVLGGGTGAWSSGNSGTASVSAGGTVTGVAAGTTNIIYTITGGCNGTPSAQQSVTVNPNASIASVTGSTPLCIGASTGYTANSVVLGGGVGTWSSSASGTASVNGSGTVTGVTAGSCNIIYTITGGCNGTPSAQQSITITPNSSIASVTGSSPICPGATTNYAANSIVLGGGTGAWSSSNSGIASVNGSGVVTGVSAGSCNIIYTITGGCGGTTSAQQLITVSPAAPATPGAITGSLTVCPNSSGLIYSISNVTDATTYNWTVPAGWSINAGGGSNTISVTSGSTGQNGTITVTAGNSCGTSLSSSINVSVTTVVAASVGISVSANPVCAGTSVTFTASPTNGGGTPSYQWYLNGSPIGSNSDTYTSSALTNLNQVYCIMTSSEACATGSPSTSNTIIMNIDALSVAPASINTSVNPICQGSSSLLTVQGGSLGAGASWMWYSGSCGTTYEGTGASITVNPSGNTDYFVLAQGSCNTTLCANVTVSVTAVAALASGDQTICTGDSVQISVTGTGSYSWTPGGQSAAAFYVTPGGTTTYTVTATNGSCTASDAVTVNVTGAADASITATGPYCTGQSPLLLSAVDPGGTWTGTGITNAATGLFAPAVAGAGSHAIIYTISGSCGDADTVNLSVGTSVDATISAAGPYCSDASAVTLNAATAGGTWSGAGITNTSTGLFNPAVSGSGSFDIIYAISGLCGDADTLTIVVNPAPNATVTPAGPYCLGDAAVTLNAANAGGTWSGTGITNTTNGTFDPATAGIGTHIITYIIPGSCADTSSISIVVNGVMDATITPAGPYCSNDTPVNLVAAMAGGSWAGPGITNATTGLFNPAISGSGSFNIIYAIAGSCGDADTVTIVVNPAHNASINPSGPYCETDSPVFLSSFENGGVWTGTGITNAATGSFDPALAGAGSHQIIYSISGTCGDADTITITVTALANTSITSTGPYCNNIGVFDLTAATTGGIWSGAGITNTSTGTFNPIFAGVGTHTIIYLITGACGNSDTVSLTVLPSPTANAVGTDESCIGKMDGSAVVTGTGGTAPYTYLWETSATTPDISGMAPGEYAVVVSDASGCFAADTALILGATTPCEIIVPVVYIPNIFTPNGDGSNDVLYVRGQGITAFTLSIYDRWGEMVFETSELTYGWDGTFHNKHMDAGVFVWQLHVEFIDGTVKNDKGNLTMTR